MASIGRQGEPLGLASFVTNGNGPERKKRLTLKCFATRILLICGKGRFHAFKKAIMIKHVLLLWLLLIFENIVSLQTEEIPSKSKSSQNKFISVKAACSRQALLAVVSLRDPFHGTLYARGYPLECHAEGNGSSEVKLTFGVNQCGTKVTEKADGSVEYDVFMYLQHDRHVQQASDELIHVQCEPQEVVVSSRMTNGSPQLLPAPPLPPPTIPSVSGLAADSWMDILRGKMPAAVPITEYVNVGEDVTMLIKIRQPDGVMTKVTDCFASDGSKENHQQLINSNGCTVDSAIMPNLLEKFNGKTGMKMVYTTFQIFKFPERDNLHLQCRVLVCNTTCPLESCTKPTWSVRSRFKRMSQRSGKSVLEEMNVFNSVEVKTPGVDGSLRRSPTTAASSTKDTASSTSTAVAALPSATPEDLFCLSSARMVAILGVLLGVLLVSLVVTICMCVRARELRRRLVQRQSFPYGRVHEYS